MSVSVSFQTRPQRVRVDHMPYRVSSRSHVAVTLLTEETCWVLGSLGLGWGSTTARNTKSFLRFTSTLQPRLVTDPLVEMNGLEPLRVLKFLQVTGLNSSPFSFRVVEYISSLFHPGERDKDKVVHPQRSSTCRLSPTTTPSPPHPSSVMSSAMHAH